MPGFFLSTVVHEVDAALFARIQERNLIRQHDFLANYIEIGIQKEPKALDKYTLWALGVALLSLLAMLECLCQMTVERTENLLGASFNS